MKTLEHSSDSDQSSNLRLQLLTNFSHAAKVLETAQGESDGEWSRLSPELHSSYSASAEKAVLEILGRCYRALHELSSAFEDPISDMRLMRSLERLRRLCITLLESDKPCPPSWRNPLLRFLDQFVATLVKSMDEVSYIVYYGLFWLIFASYRLSEAWS